MKNILAALLLCTLSPQSPSVKAEPADSYCQYSSHGEAECLKRLHAFLERMQHEPTSDIQLQEVYGCPLADEDSVTVDYVCGEN